jgi:hypothetical protein
MYVKLVNDSIRDASGTDWRFFSYLHETYNNYNVPYFIFQITSHKA